MSFSVRQNASVSHTICSYFANTKYALFLKNVDFLTTVRYFEGFAPETSACDVSVNNFGLLDEVFFFFNSEPFFEEVWVRSSC